MEFMKTLGFSGLRLSPRGSNHLIQTLGRNHIAILGTKATNGIEGHAVIVVAARYSFVHEYFPSLEPKGGKAFNTLTVLDPAINPAEGNKITIPAELIESEIDFVLSQDIDSIQ